MNCALRWTVALISPDAVDLTESAPLNEAEIYVEAGGEYVWIPLADALAVAEEITAAAYRAFGVTGGGEEHRLRKSLREYVRREALRVRVLDDDGSHCAIYPALEATVGDGMMDIVIGDRRGVTKIDR